MTQASESNHPPARLLAICEVDHDQRVRCGNLGCGHSVHKAIHVVQEGQLKNKELRDFGEYRTQRLVLAAWDADEASSGQ